MKIRTDFVTNSSSSSFVVAYKSVETMDENILKQYPFLLNYYNLFERVIMVEGDGDTTRGEKVTSVEELNHYFLEAYRYNKLQTLESVLEEEDLTDEYEMYKKYIDSGFCILFKDVGYNDTFCENMFKELAKDEPNFIILRED